MRICIKCHKEKDLEQFRKLHGEGFSGYCESCRGAARRSMRKIKTREERTEAHRTWRKQTARHKEYMDAYNLSYHRGITVEQFTAMFEAQDGKCAICKGPSGDRRFHVDHCHTTNVIRGLLCSNCNTGLGLFCDDPTRLESAVVYLKRGGQLDMDLKVQK